MRKLCKSYNHFVFTAKVRNDFQSTYNSIEMSGTKTVWEKYIYDSKVIDDYLECSFVCKNLEQENACDLFAFEGQTCYLGKSA